MLLLLNQIEMHVYMGDKQMRLPNQVEEVLRQVQRKDVRDILRKAFESWENESKDMTRAVLLGLHEVPPPAKIALNIFPPAGLAFQAASCLEWLIEYCARQAARNGKLSEADRRAFNHFMDYKAVHLPKPEKAK